MNTYWLSRSGGAAEGPFAESQLVAMWYGGQFLPSDLLCMEGTRDWQPASAIMVAAKPAEPAPLELIAPAPVAVAEPEVRTAHRSQREENGCLTIGLVILGIAGLFFFLIPGLLFFILAAMVHKVQWICSACGNRIEKTSRHCPACHATFVVRRGGGWSEWDTWFAVAIVAVLLTMLLLAFAR